MARRRSKLEIKDGPEGLEIALPRRVGNSKGMFSTLGIVTGLFGGVFAFAGFNTLMQGADEPSSAGGLAMIVGLGLLLISYLLFCSRGKIVVGRDELVVYENQGPMVHRRPVPLAGLEGLGVYQAARTSSNSRASARLQLWWRDRSEQYVLAHYNPRILRQVAERIAAELEFVGEGEAPDIDYYAPEALAERQPYEEVLQSTEAPVVRAQPDGKRAHLEYTDDGLVMTIPPSGMLRHYSTMVGFGAIFFVAGLFFGGVIVMNMDEDPDIKPFLFLPIAFVVMGLSVMLWPVAASRRSSRFEIVGDELRIRRKGGFWGEKVHKWTKDQIQAIEVNDSMTSVNDRTLRQLSIKVGYMGRGMLIGRDEVELQWIAAKLRDGLGITADAG